MNTKLFYRVCCGLAFGAGAWSILPQHGDPIYGKSIVNTNRPPTPTGALVLTNGYARFIDMNDFLRQAITNGEVCAIVGHQWNPYEGTILITQSTHRSRYQSIACAPSASAPSSNSPNGKW